MTSFIDFTDLVTGEKPSNFPTQQNGFKLMQFGLGLKLDDSVLGVQSLGPKIDFGWRPIKVDDCF